MKKESLSDALNHLNDDIIEQADAARKVNKKYKIMRIARACVAACLVIAISIGSIILLPKLKPNPQNPQINTPESTDLPLLTVSETAGDGMGFSAYMAYDISELVSANPWTEDCKFDTLPVYNNTLNLNERYDMTNIDYDKMNLLLLDVAKRFGLKEDEIEVKRVRLTSYDHLIVKTDSFEIWAYPELTADIKFEPTIPLPDKYNFTHNNSSYDDMLAIAKYLQTQYRDIIGFENPQINITGGEYTYDSEQGYHIEFFDLSGDDIQDIINYNFNRVAFYCGENGTLRLIRVFQPDLSDKIGDYPIIAADEAKELLANGNFITTVPYGFPGMEYVKKVELVYRNTHWLDKTYMPYYLFYIELPELENQGNIATGLKTYGFYYVPAVEGKYLSDMPVWDGSFN